VLCANAPETKDNDFTWKDFQTRNNSELLAIFGNFVNRTVVLTHKYFEGRVPEVTQLNANDLETLESMASSPERIASSIEAFRFREALNEVMNLARLGNKYLTDNEPWKVFKTDPARVQTVLNVSLQICANLAIVAEPFLPFSANSLNRILNLQSSKWAFAGKSDLLLSGHQLNQAEFLFEKIEDEAIQKQLDKLEAAKAANLEAAATIAPSKPNIGYDDFAKLDIRVGTIVEAEKVAKTKKLLKLKVDTGIDQRTVVSGIAEHYAPEAIVGQKVVMLVNLAPKNLKGIDSQGMILMAEDATGKLCFVSPTEAFRNGSEVK
jgi:methionyl-tRNA synthetase